MLTNYSEIKGMSTIPDNEARRIAALYQFQIIDTHAEKDFDDIVALASQICETPVSTISFVDKSRVWFKACVGMQVKEIPRDIAFWAKDIESKDLIFSNDASKD